MKFLITGHNEFSIGMQSALTMIAGTLEEVAVIPFRMEDSVETYREKIVSEMNTHEEIVCFTDLLGGTPFKTCAELSVLRKEVFVLSGTNLGMLLEAVSLRTFMKDSSELCRLVIQAGKNNVTLFTENTVTEEIPEDGI